MDELIQQIENGTADIPIYSKGNYQVTFGNEPASYGLIIGLMMPIPVTAKANVNVSLVFVDGELSVLSPDSPPNLHAMPNDAGILRVR